MLVSELRKAILPLDPALPVFVADARGSEWEATTIVIERHSRARFRIVQDQTRPDIAITVGDLAARLRDADQNLPVFVAGDDGVEREAEHAGPAWYGLETDGLGCLRIRQTRPLQPLDYDWTD